VFEGRHAASRLRRDDANARPDAGGDDAAAMLSSR
jgi:hypothetical protein